MKRKLVYGAEYGTPDSIRRKSGRNRYPAIKITEEQIIEAFKTWFYDYALDMASDKFGYSFEGCTIDEVKDEYKFEVEGLNKRNPELYITLIFTVNMSNSEANMYTTDYFDIWGCETKYQKYINIPGSIKQYTSADQVLEYLIENNQRLTDAVFNRSMTFSELDNKVDNFNAQIDKILDIPNINKYRDIIENIEVELYTWPLWSQDGERGKRIHDVTWEDISKGIRLRCVYTTLKPISDNVLDDFFFTYGGDGNFLIDDRTAGFTIWIRGGRDLYEYARKQLDNGLRYLFMDDSDEEMAEKIFDVILSDSYFRSRLIKALRGYNYTVYPDRKGNAVFEVLRDEEHTYGGRPIKIVFCNIDEYRERGRRAIKLWDLAAHINKAFNYRRRNYGDKEDI